MVSPALKSSFKKIQFFSKTKFGLQLLDTAVKVHV